MRTALIEAVGKVTVTTVPDPTPGPREVVVDVAACGLRGTDLHILEGRVRADPARRAGSRVRRRDRRHRQRGERAGHRRQGGRRPVPVLPGVRYCRAGRGNLCDNWNAIGVSVAGGAAEYALAPVGNCVKLPDHVSLQDAALIEPLSCVRGYDVLNNHLGAEVLIYGSGTMGLMMLELAKRTGAASVDVLDLNPERLATARALGCSTATIEPHLQPGDHHHRLDGGVAQLRTGGEPVRHRRARPRGFISDRLPLARYPQALEQFRAGVGRKIVSRCRTGGGRTPRRTRTSRTLTCLLRRGGAQALAPLPHRERAALPTDEDARLGVAGVLLAYAGSGGRRAAGAPAVSAGRPGAAGRRRACRPASGGGCRPPRGRRRGRSSAAAAGSPARPAGPSRAPR